MHKRYLPIIWPIIALALTIFAVSTLPFAQTVATAADATPTPTPTAPLPRITADNADRLIQFARLGNGSVGRPVWSPNGKYIAMPGSLGLWIQDATDFNKPPQLFERKPPEPALDVVFSPDSKWVASLSYDSIWLWSAAANQDYPILLPTRNMRVSHLLFSPDSKYLVSSYVPFLADLPEWHTGLWFYDLTKGKMAEPITDPLSGPLQVDHLLLDMTFSHDSKSLVTVDSTGTIHSWHMGLASEKDMALYGDAVFAVKELSTIKGVNIPSDYRADFPSWVNLPLITGWFMKFVPDGTTLIFRGYNAPTQLWDLKTGKAQSTWKDHTGAEHPLSPTVEFSADGKFVATIAADLTMQIWDTTTGELRNTLPQKDSYIRFSQHGSLLFGGHSSNSLWDVKTGQPLPDFDIYDYVDFNFADFNPDETIMAMLDLSTLRIKLFDVRTSKPLTSFGQWTGVGQQEEYAAKMTFSADGTALVTSSIRSSVQLWDGKIGQNRLAKDNYSFGKFSLSPDGKLLAIRDSKNDNKDKLYVYDVATGKEKFVLTDLGLSIREFSFNEDSTKILVFGTNDDQGHVSFYTWDIATQTRSSTINYAWKADYDTLLFSPDRNSVAWKEDLSVILWNLKDHTLKTILYDPDTMSGHVFLFSPDGKYLAATTYETTRVFNAQTGNLVRELPIRAVLRRDVLDNPNFWKVFTNPKLSIPSQVGPFALNIFAFSPDNSLMVTVTNSGFEIRDTKFSNRITIINLPVARATFSPDGSILALASDDGVVRLLRVGQ